MSTISSSNTREEQRRAQGREIVLLRRKTSGLTSSETRRGRKVCSVRCRCTTFPIFSFPRKRKDGTLFERLLRGHNCNPVTRVLRTPCGVSGIRVKMVESRDVGDYQNHLPYLAFSWTVHVLCPDVHLTIRVHRTSLHFVSLQFIAFGTTSIDTVSPF